MRETLKLKPKPKAPVNVPLMPAKPRLERVYPNRPEIAAAEGPHWIVSRVPPSVRPGTMAFRHGTRDSAEAEAARLARLNPGISFLVYESGACFWEPLGNA